MILAIMFSLFSLVEILVDSLCLTFCTVLSLSHTPFFKGGRKEKGQENCRTEYDTFYSSNFNHIILSRAVR